MKVVAPITRETFEPYAKIGKSNGAIQDWICGLLLRLVQTDDPAKVRKLCQEEIAWLENQRKENGNRDTALLRARPTLAPIAKRLQLGLMSIHHQLKDL